MEELYPKRADVRFWGSLGCAVVAIKSNGEPHNPINIIKNYYDEELAFCELDKAPEMDFMVLLPEGVVAVLATMPEGDAELQKVAKEIGIDSIVEAPTGLGRVCLFKVDESTSATLSRLLSGSLKLFDSDCLVPVPTLDIFTEWYTHNKSETPLSKFTMRGRGEVMAENAQISTPLLGLVALLGQLTLIYGVPAVGKSLIMLHLLFQAIMDGRVAGSSVYYINADDNNQGAAEKLKLLDAVGAHTLLPGEQGFDISALEGLIKAHVEQGLCKGIVVVIDTLKKVVDIMDKSASTRLGKTFRAFVQAGGTIIALAHTNKNLGANGRPAYAGTADFHQDADACLYLLPIGETAEDEVLVKFEAFKRRGPNEDQTYAYVKNAHVGYLDRFNSVRLVSSEELAAAERQASMAADSDVIMAIRGAIENGDVKKMELAKAAAANSGLGRNRIIDCVDRYDGILWDHCVRDRGAKVYRLLPDS